MEWKQRGNGKEMEWKIYEEIYRCKVEWKQSGNGKEMEWKFMKNFLWIESGTETELNGKGMEIEVWHHNCRNSPSVFCEVFINST